MIKTFSELRGKIGSIGAGKKVKITVVRKDGKEKTYKVTLKKSETANVEAESIHRMLEGAKLENSGNGKGVDISAVAKNSPAAIASLRSGDLIIGVNRQRIKNIAELRAVLKEQKGVFALNIIRGNSSLYLMIR